MITPSRYPLQTPSSPSKPDPDTESQEPDVPIHSAQPPKNKKSTPPRQSKIKSSLCKNYMIHGVCPYGERCQFAHGPQQLRCNTIENTSYKTKPCFSYLNKGYCPYGHRCNFIHKATEPLTTLPLNTKLQNFPELIEAFGSCKSGSRLLKKLSTEPTIDIYFPKY